MTALRASAPLRGTQSMVGYMGWVFSRPAIVAIEVAWRWIFGIPLLLVCWKQFEQILAAYPLESSGFNSLDAQNPWVAIVQLANVWSYYQPHVFAILRWLAAGKRALLGSDLRAWPHRRSQAPESSTPISSRGIDRVAGSMAGASRLDLLALVRMHAVGRGHSHKHRRRAGPGGLLPSGRSFSPSRFSWRGLSSAGRCHIAPLLVLLENRSVLSALGQSLRLGKAFTGKLAEINLVMGIVKLALLVVAMVFSQLRFHSATTGIRLAPPALAARPSFI